MGMFSPRTGAPSMISYLASVSLSFLAAVPAPVCSLRLISISMCLSFIRTCQSRTDQQTPSSTQGVTCAMRAAASLQSTRSLLQSLSESAGVLSYLSGGLYSRRKHA